MKLRYYVIRRLLLMIPTLFGLSVLTFTISHVVPGDPARLAAGPRATEEMVQVIVEEYGLNKPLHIQYLNYVGDVLQGNWGMSMVRQRPVATDLRKFFPATLELVIAAMGVAFVIGVPLGVISAVHRDRWQDRSSRIISLSGVSLPVFWLALVLQLVLARSLGLLPINGRFDVDILPPGRITGMYLIDSLLQADFQAFLISLRHIILPALCLSLGAMAGIARMVRSDVIEVLSSDFVTMERSLGLPERLVLAKYVMKNASIATLTMIGLYFGWSLGGSVLIEAVFDWPGIGSYAVQAAMATDFQPLMGVTLLTGFSFIFINLVTDVMYGFLDPRIRYG